MKIVSMLHMQVHKIRAELCDVLHDPNGYHRDLCFEQVVLTELPKYR